LRVHGARKNTDREENRTENAEVSLLVHIVLRRVSYTRFVFFRNPWSRDSPKKRKGLFGFL
jgi:hypothetical protein